MLSGQSYHSSHHSPTDPPVFLLEEHPTPWLGLALRLHFMFQTTGHAWILNALFSHTSTTTDKKKRKEKKKMQNVSQNHKTSQTGSDPQSSSPTSIPTQYHPKSNPMSEILLKR